jgi:hypothetical protein
MTANFQNPFMKSLLKIWELAGEKIAATGAPREQCFAFAGEHRDICKLEQFDGKPDQRLREWMSLVLSTNAIAGSY